MQLDQKTKKSMQLIARQYPEFVDFLNDWKNRELEQLPDVVAANTAFAQGRCRALKELTKMFSEAPGWTGI